MSYVDYKQLVEHSDIINISFMSQCKYVADRISDRETRYQFRVMAQTISDLLEMNIVCPSEMFKSSFFSTTYNIRKNTGQMALDIYKQTTKLVSDRYITGWTSDHCIQRLL